MIAIVFSTTAHALCRTCAHIHARTHWQALRLEHLFEQQRSLDQMDCTYLFVLSNQWRNFMTEPGYRQTVVIFPKRERTSSTVTITVAVTVKATFTVPVSQSHNHSQSVSQSVTATDTVSHSYSLSKPQSLSQSQSVTVIVRVTGILR